MLFKHYSINVKRKFKIIKRKKFKENNFNGLKIYFFFSSVGGKMKDMNIIKFAKVKDMSDC